MTRHASWWFVAAVLAAAPARAPAADTEPTLVVRARSLESLAEDVKYLGGLFGQQDAVQGLDAKLRQLSGFDLKKPFGAYAYVSPGIVDSSFAALVPVTGEKDLLDQLAAFGHKPDKDNDGVYTLAVPPVPFPLHFRFAHGYAYVTVRDKETLAKDKLIPPAKLFPAGQSELLVVSLRFDHIPDMVRQIVLSQMDLRLPEFLEQKQPDETDAQHRLRAAVMKEVAGGVAALIRECRELRLHLDLDRKAHNVALQLSVEGARDTELAKTIAGLGKVPSPFAGLAGKGAAASYGLNLTVPESVAKALHAALNEGVQKELERIQDPAQKALLTRLVQSVEPTLKAGRLQVGAALHGPSAGGKFTGVVGARVQDGPGIEKALRDALKVLRPEERELIQLDHTKLGATNVHRLTLPKREIKAEFARAFGEGPVYAALSAEAVYMAVGENALDALKQALALKPAAAPMAHAELAIARVAPLMDDAGTDGFAKAAQKVFQGADKDNDRIRLSLEGGPVLKWRLEAKTALLKFFYELATAPPRVLGGPVEIQRKPEQK